jgi:PadR family transcriptional regulator, regulatory protein PadR
MNFIQGTLDLLILKALADGPLHGYDVVEWIRRVTRGAIQVEDGALYASLHRMEAREWLEHEWRVSPKGRRAKYYQLTALGTKHLRAGERDWSKFAEAVFKVVDARQDA